LAFLLDWPSTIIVATAKRNPPFTGRKEQVSGKAEAAAPGEAGVARQAIDHHIDE
jgi:hypothetical protein